MTFKTDWEKTSATHHIPDEVLVEIISTSLRGASRRGNLRTKRSPQVLSGSHDDILLLSGGCANLNYLIKLDRKYILRIYLRDPEAAIREQKIGELLKDCIPLPQTLFIGEHQEYHFALTTYLEGIPLAELLLSDKPHDIEHIMYDVGKLLTKINRHRFEHSGFLTPDLKPKAALTASDYLAHAQKCLRDQNVLSKETLEECQSYLTQNRAHFPDQNDARLVHADFDPANILVTQIDSSWKISGILDWEFAFSGSPLTDIANMLRYSHEMPAEFETGFIKGVGAKNLPHNWRESLDLLNLIALLDCLTRTDPETQPQRCADLIKQIEIIHLTKT